MALSSSVYGSVGTPRIFIDYVQFCKATNVPIQYWSHGNTYPDDADNPGIAGYTYQDVWNMNPAKTTPSYSELTSEQNSYYTRWGFK